MNTTHALERQIRFLTEKQSEPYEMYGEWASQVKIGYGAKSNQRAAGAAGWPVVAVRGL